MSDPTKMPDEFYGMPVFRDGDNVYIINNMPDLLSVQNMADAMLERMDHIMLRQEEYCCPFDLSRAWITDR